MAGLLVVLQAGEVADEQPGLMFTDMHRRARLAVRKAGDLVDTYRIALLGDEQALAGRVVGQAFEALVTVEIDAQRKLLRLLGVDDAGLLVYLDAQQPLPAFIADHVNAFGNVLDGLRIAEADQGNRA